MREIAHETPQNRLRLGLPISSLVNCAWRGHRLPIPLPSTSMTAVGTFLGAGRKDGHPEFLKRGCALAAVGIFPSVCCPSKTYTRQQRDGERDVGVGHAWTYRQ